MFEYSGEPVHGVDCAWLRMDRPTNPMVITAMAVVDPIDFASLRALIAQRFLAFERFRRKPVQHSGLYFWEADEHFDLDCHLRRAALPSPADKAALQRYVSELASTALDPTKPLWQFHLVENYGERCVVIMRVHHCYADGLALMSVFGALTDATSTCDLDLAIADAANDHEPLDFQPWSAYQRLLETAAASMDRYARAGLKLSEESLHLLREPASAKGYGRSLLNVMGEIARLTALPAEGRTTLKGSLGVSKVAAWSDPIPLPRFKAIGQKLGCTLNDVLLSCVAGVLRRYLQSQQTVDPQLELHAAVPVNIRGEDDASEGAIGELGNRFGTVFVPLPIGIASPVERLFKVKHEMLALRRSVQPGVSYGLLAAVGLLPAKMQQTVMDAYSRKSSLVLSNVPGARQTRFLAGQQIHETLFWVPQTGDIALGISLLSYNGQVQIGVMADKRVIGDPQGLILDFPAELDEHERWIMPFSDSAQDAADTAATLKSRTR